VSDSDHHTIAVENAGLRMKGLAPLVLIMPVYARLLMDANLSLPESPEMAVVLAHSAAELCTEAHITSLLDQRGVGNLTEPVLDIFNSYDICNDKLRAIYIALTGDKISEALFWHGVKESKKRRNAVVHRGKACTVDDAKATVKAMTDLVYHMDHVVRLASVSPPARP
jgi:hypothetical protein